MSPLALGTLAATGLAAWHHAGWPLLLRAASRRAPPPSPAPLEEAALPAIAVVMPAHDEATHIAAKLRNIASLDYPADRLLVVLACDGCTDGTAAVARATLAEPACAHLRAEIREFPTNRGKVAVLNAASAAVAESIVALTDVSAMLPRDALRRAAAHFADPRLGAVGGTYRLGASGVAGEAGYWAYQRAVKAGEAALGAPLGMHGAFWAFRRAAFAPLPADTINDDFVLPMGMFLRGWRLAYDTAIGVSEAEGSDRTTEAQRRRRIAAGNAQQLARLLPLLHPRHGGVALAFASGKALRVLMPFLLLAAALGAAALAPSSPFFAALAAGEAVAIGGAVLGLALGRRAPAPLAVCGYALAGHAASGIGVVRHLASPARGAWRRARPAPAPSAARCSAEVLPPHVAALKRTFDLAVAGVALVLTLPLWPVIALAVRVESPGPAIYRQRRVGRATAERIEIFEMLKFRSMRQDAEAASGAVWATKDDPRVTRVGRFLRKSRLDELPQLLNVLRGDMSIIGPRPERPGLYGRLDAAVPFFADRTAGLRPGITGLAQIHQGYDATIEDVRRKAAWDHAYALRCGRAGRWIATDVGVAVRTLAVMAGGHGR